MSQAKYYSMSFEQGTYNTAHGKVIEPIVFEDESDQDAEWKTQMIRRAKQKQPPRRTGRER